jgi:hypothetical protein
VINDERFASVNVAEVAGAVIVTLFSVVAVPLPIVTFLVALSTKSLRAIHEPFSSVPAKKNNLEVDVLRNTDRSYCSAGVGREAPA